MKEGISTILHSNVPKHAFHWTPLIGSTVPSTPPGSTTHLATHVWKFNHVQNLQSQHQKLEDNLANPCSTLFQLSSRSLILKIWNSCNFSYGVRKCMANRISPLQRQLDCKSRTKVWLQNVSTEFLFQPYLYNEQNHGMEGGTMKWKKTKTPGPFWGKLFPLF